jgi:NodT family efflux transporter outer membrane factor (OMF) lipoprotein
MQRIHSLCRLHRMTTILLLVLFGMAAGCSKAPEEKAQHKSVEVTVFTVEARDVPVSGEYVAQTQSSRLVNIQARVSGFLDRRVYTEGAMVKEGDTLFLMDQKPFQAQLDQTQAAMARQVAAMETAKANLARVKPLAELDALSQKDLDDAKGQYESYAVAVDQAKAQVETAAAPIPSIESQIAQTENALSILLGRNPGPIERGKSILELTMPSVPSGVPSQVLERRPDILQAEQQLVAANAQIGAAKALYFQTITLTGGYGQASSDLSDLFKGPARVWNYGGSVTGPIFAGGAIYGQVLQAEAGQKEALLSYQAAIQSAFSDVESALVANQKFVEQQKAQERLVRANREYARLSRLQYKGGYVPYSTVLQAEQQLFPSELILAQTRDATFSSLVAIYQSMGGGWVLEADKLTASGDDEDTEAHKAQDR